MPPNTTQWKPNKPIRAFCSFVCCYLRFTVHYLRLWFARCACVENVNESLWKQRPACFFFFTSDTRRSVPGMFSACALWWCPRCWSPTGAFATEKEVYVIAPIPVINCELVKCVTLRCSDLKHLSRLTSSRLSSRRAFRSRRASAVWTMHSLIACSRCEWASSSCWNRSWHVACGETACLNELVGSDEFSEPTMWSSTARMFLSRFCFWVVGLGVEVDERLFNMRSEWDRGVDIQIHHIYRVRFMLGCMDMWMGRGWPGRPCSCHSAV